MPDSSQTINTPGSLYNEIMFAVRQILKTDVHTALPVRVQAVYPRAPGSTHGDVAGFVDAELMIDQIAPDGTRLETGTIFNLPYFRLQAGLAAIVIDPVVGDDGLAVFAERDISRFKKTHEKNIPPSYRMHSLSDGFFFGGFSDKIPEVYIRISRGSGVLIECANRPCVVNCQSASVAVVDNAEIVVGGNTDISVGGEAAVTVGGDAKIAIGGHATVKAQGTTLNSPANTINGNIEVNGNIGVNGGLWVRDDSDIYGHVRLHNGATINPDATIGGKSFNGHRHPGVETGGGTTGGPV